jgi:hypothetical protein
MTTFLIDKRTIVERSLFAEHEVAIPFSDLCNFVDCLLIVNSVLTAVLHQNTFFRINLRFQPWLRFHVKFKALNMRFLSNIRLSREIEPEQFHKICIW